MSAEVEISKLLVRITGDSTSYLFMLNDMLAQTVGVVTEITHLYSDLKETVQSWHQDAMEASGAVAASQDHLAEAINGAKKAYGDAYTESAQLTKSNEKQAATIENLTHRFSEMGAVLGAVGTTWPFGEKEQDPLWLRALEAMDKYLGTSLTKIDPLVQHMKELAKQAEIIAKLNKGGGAFDTQKDADKAIEQEYMNDSEKKLDNFRRQLDASGIRNTPGGEEIADEAFKEYQNQLQALDEIEEKKKKIKADEKEAAEQAKKDIEDANRAEQANIDDGQRQAQIEAEETKRKIDEENKAEADSIKEAQGLAREADAEKKKAAEENAKEIKKIQDDLATNQEKHDNYLAELHRRNIMGEIDDETLARGIAKADKDLAEANKRESKLPHERQQEANKLVRQGSDEFFKLLANIDVSTKPVPKEAEIKKGKAEDLANKADAPDIPLLERIADGIEKQLDKPQIDVQPLGIA